MLVASQSPVDQHYLANPEELWDKPMRELCIDLDNAAIVEAHMQCAAFEMPMKKQDEKWFGPLTAEICAEKLVVDKDGWYHTHPKSLPYPAKDVSLRGVEELKYAIIDVTKLRQGGAAKIIEELEFSRALFELYEGGIVSSTTIMSRIVGILTGVVPPPRHALSCTGDQSRHYACKCNTHQRGMGDRTAVRPFSYLCFNHPLTFSLQRLYEHRRCSDTSYS